MRLSGKTALVTGRGRGIGRAIALALAAEGAQVAVLDIDGLGIKGLALVADLTRRAVTRAIPLGRVGRPDAAAAVVSFASPAAAYVTGQTLSVSGGLTMC